MKINKLLTLLFQLSILTIIFASFTFAEQTLPDAFDENSTENISSTDSITDTYTDKITEKTGITKTQIIILVCAIILITALILLWKIIKFAFRIGLIIAIIAIILWLIKQLI